MDVEELCELGYVVKLLLLSDDLPRDGHLGEDVPQDDADDDVVAKIKYHAFSVLVDVPRLEGLRSWGSLRVGGGFLQPN